MTVMEILSDESKWCKGSYAQDADGNPLADWNDPSACRWCVYGAIFKAYGVGRSDYLNYDSPASVCSRAVRDAVRREGVFSWIDSFNDADDTTFADVQRVLKKAGVA